MWHVGAASAGKVHGDGHWQCELVGSALWRVPWWASRTWGLLCAFVRLSRWRVRQELTVWGPLLRGAAGSCFLSPGPPPRTALSSVTVPCIPTPQCGCHSLLTGGQTGPLGSLLILPPADENPASTTPTFWAVVTMWDWGKPQKCKFRICSEDLTQSLVQTRQNCHMEKRTRRARSAGTSGRHRPRQPWPVPGFTSLTAPSCGLGPA